MLTVASLGPDPTKEFQKVSWEAASLSHPAVAGVLLDTSCSPLARAATSWLGSYYSRLGVPVHDNEIAWEQLYESQTPPVWMSSSSASECVLNLGPLPDQDDAMYEWCAYIRKRSDESLAAARKGLFQSGSSFVVTALVRAHAHTPTHQYAQPNLHARSQGASKIENGTVLGIFGYHLVASGFVDHHTCDRGQFSVQLRHADGQSAVWCVCAD